VTKRWPEANSPVRANLKFFVALRNKIEHRYTRSQEALAIATGWHAHALLFNYEMELAAQFGVEASLAHRLRFPVFVGSFTEEGEQLRWRMRASLPAGLRRFLARYHDELDPQVPLRVPAAAHAGDGRAGRGRAAAGVRPALGVRRRPSDARRPRGLPPRPPQPVRADRAARAQYRCGVEDRAVEAWVYLAGPTSKVAAAAGIGRVTPHQLRHTLATQAINRGMSLEAIAALLGHRWSTPSGTPSPPRRSRAEPACSRSSSFWRALVARHDVALPRGDGERATGCDEGPAGAGGPSRILG
jgi:uncharacterized protein DUF3644/integrase-like protein